MSIELSDAGVMAVGGDPVRVLETEPGTVESPGYALHLKKRLVVGHEALCESKLHPRQVNNRFWSQLSTHALSEKTTFARNYAEVAYAHLDRIREHLRMPDVGWLIAVPGFLDESKLGILLGIARELSIRVAALVNNAVAAARATADGRPLLHVDVHLHRVEISRLAQGERIALEKSHAIPEDGWDNLMEQLARGLADEFVKATRFDPLHDAATEQQLHNRLPDLLRECRGDRSVPMEIDTGRTTHNLSVLPQMLLESSAGLRRKICDGVRVMMEQRGAGAQPASIQLSHRAGMVPGLQEELGALTGARVETLAPGAGARGALALQEGADAKPDAKGIPFVTSRLRRPDEPDPASASPEERAPHPQPAEDLPTHVLYGDEAYPIDEGPLVIGTDPAASDTIVIPKDVRHAAARHCTLQRKNGRPVLTVLGSHKTYLDGTDVSGSTAVNIGQRVQLGDPPQELRLIVVRP